MLLVAVSKPRVRKSVRVSTSLKREIICPCSLALKYRLGSANKWLINLFFNCELRRYVNLLILRLFIKVSNVFSSNKVVKELSKITKLLSDFTIMALFKIIFREKTLINSNNRLKSKAIAIKIIFLFSFLKKEI